MNNNTSIQINAHPYTLLLVLVFFGFNLCCNSVFVLQCHSQYGRAGNKKHRGARCMLDKMKHFYSIQILATYIVDTLYYPSHLMAYHAYDLYHYGSIGTSMIHC